MFRPDVPPAALTQETDAFGHRDYALTIASALRDAEAPFTIGLFGPWGLGKTTIIEEVARQVSSACGVVTFDAWRYDGDTLRRHFIRELAHQLDEAENLKGYDVAVELNELDVDEAAPGRSQLTVDRGAGVRALIAALAISSLVFVQLKYQPVETAGIAAGAVVAGVITLALFAIGSIGQIVQVSQRTETRRRLVDPEKFTEKFEDILACMRKERLVVIIDNLDRCTPTRMEEVFETLNTYLEPSGSPRGRPVSARLRKRRGRLGKPDAVFLISADDQALKRHLEAREAASQVVGARSRDDLGRYADEYLRKIFKSSIPIKPVLDADIREYVRKELEAFCAARELDDEASAQLAQLVTAALRKNPRRVRQLVNNLELRLRLLDERYKSRQLASPLAHHVPLVTKLLLLEEEWPDSYRAIEADPRKLDTWHEQQLAGEELGAPNGNSDTFVGFLAISRSVRSDHLRAFINLKQSEVEVRLPRYSDFRDALLAADLKAVENILGESNDNDRSAYAAELAPILTDELRGGYIENARVVVETAAAIPDLNPSVVTDLLRHSVRTPALRAALRDAAPKPVLSAAAALNDHEFSLLVQPFLALEAYGEGRLAAVADALVGVADRLSASAADQLRTAIASDQVIDEFAAYLPLVSVRPDVLPAVAAEKALDSLGDDFDVTGAAFAVARVGLTNDPLESERDRFMNFASQKLTAVVQAPSANEEFPPLATAVSEVFAQLESVSEPSHDAFNNAIQPFYAQAVAAGVADDLLDLFGASLDLRPQGAKPLADQLVNAIASAAPDLISEYVLGHDEPVPRLLQHSVLAALNAQAKNAGTSEVRAGIARAILRLDASDELGFLADAVQWNIENDRPDVALEYLAGHSNELESSRPELARVAAARVRAHSPSVPASTAACAIALADALLADELDQLVAYLAQWIASSNTSEAEIEEVLTLGENSSSFKAQVPTLLNAVWEEAKGQAEPAARLLNPLADRWHLLDRDRRLAFIDQTRIWSDNVAHARAELARVVTRIRKLTGDEKAAFVEILLAAERLEPESSVENRALLLSTARDLPGKSVRADRAVHARLSALESGGESDVHVLQQLSPQDQAGAT